MSLEYLGRGHIQYLSYLLSFFLGSAFEGKDVFKPSASPLAKGLVVTGVAEGLWTTGMARE